jgi:hypothetical protein
VPALSVMKHPASRVCALCCVISMTLAPAWGEEGELPAPEEAVSGLTLVYVSDYFSFVGEDEAGRVAFALDNNRGRDGDTWQAEHFAVLHDERRGWVEMVGGGRYDNTRRELVSIPDSPAFQFHGHPRQGMTIISEDNRLRLQTEAIPERLARTHNTSRYWMGSASALLEWEGRTLRGRVIYEYLWLPQFNRLTRRYPGLWKEFHGLYARLEGGGDLYLHSQQSPLLQPLVGTLAGFAVVEGRTIPLENLRISVLERRRAWGLYSWPVAWRGGWKNGREQSTLSVTLSALRVISNWVIGGFAMGVIQGEVTYNGRTVSLYGFGELLI